MKKTSTVNTNKKPQLFNYSLLQEIITKENKNILTKIISQLENDGASYDFLNPVDYKNDYPNIIKTPMDLSTVKKNLKKGNYKKVSNCLSDIQLIWNNCKVYNDDLSEIFRLANHMEKLTNKLIIKLFVNNKEKKNISQIKNKIEEDKNELNQSILSTMDIEKQFYINPINSSMTSKELIKNMNILNKEGISIVIKLLQHSNSKAIQDDSESECFIIDADLIEEEVLNKIKSVFMIKELNINSSSQ